MVEPSSQTSVTPFQQKTHAGSLRSLTILFFVVVDVNVCSQSSAAVLQLPRHVRYRALSGLIRKPFEVFDVPGPEQGCTPKVIPAGPLCADRRKDALGSPVPSLGSISPNR